MSSIRTMVAAAALIASTLIFAGCTEPLTMYQVPDSAGYYAEGKKILVMPFMDTRTFVPGSDPHTANLGNHARAIFVDAMRESAPGSGIEILTPAIAQPLRSMTNAEVAEVGRRHGADAVVAGQIFSFTDTRAASIPPRAGMFVRVISSHDGALLFTGDHYQAASRPMAEGGRDLQARNVSDRLVEGFFAAAPQASVDAVVAAVASQTAFAMLNHDFKTTSAPTPANREGGTPENQPLPEPPPLPLLSDGSLLDADAWDEQMLPEPPPLLDFNDDFYAQAAPANTANATTDTAAKTPVDDAARADADAPATRVAARTEPDDMPTPLPPPPLDELGDLSDVAARVEPTESAETTKPAETAKQTDAVIAAVADGKAATPTPAAAGNSEKTTPDLAANDAPAETIDELPELDLARVDPNMIPVDAVYPPPMEAAKLSGDDLAADLFASEGDLWGASETESTPGEIAGGDVSGSTPAISPTEFRVAASPAPIVVPEARPDAVIPNSETAAAMVSRVALAPDATDVLQPFEVAFEARKTTAPLVASSATDGDNGPIVSVPLAAEQPRTFKSIDLELAEEPAETALQDDAFLVALPDRSGGPIRVLILPYHDRENPNNLIPNTGGGEVVTTLYGTQLALDPQVRVLWDATGLATHRQQISREDALELGRLAGADYVVRGQVVEFRRAQSVPSFYSVVISTAVLAAQVFFAEMSGVDVATEVYRVADGACVMSRRDRAQQKYVVQAEKTVRRMATAMADSVSRVIREATPETMDPLIDGLSPLTVFTNPR